MNTEKIKTFHLSDHEKEALLFRVAELLGRREELDFAYAYGSFIEPGPFRDLDVALFVNRRRVPQRRYEYETELERMLSEELNTPFPIEARISNGASIPFVYAVIQGRLLVDRHPTNRIEFVEKAIARYLDIKPVLRHYSKEAFSDEAQP